MHWVSAAHAISAEIRLYDKLFSKADPNDVEEDGSFLDNLNPNSLEILTDAKLEPSLAKGRPEEHFQLSEWDISAWIETRRRRSWFSIGRCR